MDPFSFVIMSFVYKSAHLLFLVLCFQSPAVNISDVCYVSIFLLWMLLFDQFEDWRRGSRTLRVFVWVWILLSWILMLWIFMSASLT